MLSFFDAPVPKYLVNIFTTDPAMIGKNLCRPHRPLNLWLDIEKTSDSDNMNVFTEPVYKIAKSIPRSKNPVKIE